MKERQVLWSVALRAMGAGMVHTAEKTLREILTQGPVQILLTKAQKEQVRATADMLSAVSQDFDTYFFKNTDHG